MSRATAIKIGRVLFFIGIANLMLIFSYQLFAKEVQIIDIKRNLQLSNHEPVFVDYYLNAGADLGLKPGTLFTLYRRTSVIDRLGSNQGKPMSLPVGKIKIIYVSKDLSVARVEKIEKNDGTPILELRGVMLGDLINVGSAEMAEGDEGKTASYGPQGTNLSFEAAAVQIERKPAADLPAPIEKPIPEAKEETLEWKSRPVQPMPEAVESTKAQLNPSDSIELPLIR